MLQLLVLLSAPCLEVPAQKPVSPAAAKPPPAVQKEFRDLGLTVALPASFTELAEAPEKGNQLRQRWTAKLGSASLQIDLYAVPIDARFDFKEPEDVMEMLLYNNLRDVSNGDASFSFEDQRLVEGNFGVCPYVSLARGALHDREGTQETGELFLLGGMLEKYGYSLEVTATPQPGLDAAKEIVRFLESGISYKGPVREWKWTDAEAKERWTRAVPEKLASKLEIIRTEHFIVMTDSSGGKSFADQMEKNYQAIKKTFPFDDVAGRLLMPVFLFKTPDEYYEFFAKQFNTSVEEGSRSKGIAYGDWYATWYESPGDPVHIHEGTHQIFRNRLRLSGGGSWFQEGVAEYMSTTKNDRNVAANTVRKGRHTALYDFIKIRSLLFSPKEDKKGGDEAATHYELAALLIEFLHDSKFGKDKFQDFVRAVGLSAPNSPAAIERAVKAMYQTDLAGLDKQWVEYCKQRH